MQPSRCGAQVPSTCHRPFPSVSSSRVRWPVLERPDSRASHRLFPARTLFSASVSARWPSDAGVFGLPVSRSRCDAGGERRLRTTWPRRTHAREASRRHRRRGRGAGRHTSTDQAAFGRASPLVPDGRARAGGAGFARRPRRDPAPGRLGRRPNDAAQHASSALAALRVQAVDATPVLRALSNAGRRVRGLTVAEARLEDVFLHLTDPPGRT